MVVVKVPRRSLRLQALQTPLLSSPDEAQNKSNSKSRSSRKHTTTANALPRTRQNQLLAQKKYLYVIGIDEAGRGPLAGPVVAAAAMVPTDIAGIVDSKKLTKEEHREELYEQIIASPNVKWAVAVVDALTIDEINILQASLLAMTMATQAILLYPNQSSEPHPSQASCNIQGCYVVRGQSDASGMPLEQHQQHIVDPQQCIALIDGNQIPKTNMPCDAECIVKGDSKEYLIAAASILAKVTRDRLMRGYDVMYPVYKLGQHKGYPTAAHMALVKQYGASPIHRRTFAPLKHMVFDEQGRVVIENS